MTPSLLLAADLADAHRADLRREAAEPRRSCGPDGCTGFFTSIVVRVRSDVRRLQLGPSSGTAPCPC